MPVSVTKWRMTSGVVNGIWAGVRVCVVVVVVSVVLMALNWKGEGCRGRDVVNGAFLGGNGEVLGGISRC